MGLPVHVPLFHHLDSPNKGCYTINCNKWLAFPEDNDKCKSTLALQDGDLLTVELDPTANKVIYSKKDAEPFVQATSIGTATNEPIHFCVFLSAGSDISIV